MPDTALIGTTLAGRFRITGVIGEGGMATVYRGVQDAEPGQLAIKIMNPDLAKEPRFVRRFRREAKAASMLKHPNTVRIIEFGVDQGMVFLAMELLEGFDLAMLLHRERKIGQLRAVQIAIQVCRALSAAHEQSIIHRDLKPDNIMLVRKPASVELPVPNMSAADFVKVLDFGIAKILDDDAPAAGDPRAEPQSSQFTSERTALTRVGTIVGTPAYMAPEQGRAEAVDARTDVYAVGVLLYELVTGRVPFTGETPMQVVMRHVNEPPVPPSQHAQLHPALDKLIMRALSKWPTERQQSAQEMAFELVQLIPLLGGATQASVDPSRTLVIEAEPPKPTAKPVAPVRPAAGRPAAPPPPDAAPAFPTLNIEVPDDLFPTAPAASAKPSTDPAPTQRQEAPAAPAGGHPHASTMNSPAEPPGAAPRVAGPGTARMGQASPQVAVARAPSLNPGAELSQTMTSALPEDDEDDVPTMMKAVEAAPGEPPPNTVLMGGAKAGAAAAPAPARPAASASQPVAINVPKVSAPEAIDPTLVASKDAVRGAAAKAAKESAPTGFESTLVVGEPPPDVAKARASLVDAHPFGGTQALDPGAVPIPSAPPPGPNPPGPSDGPVRKPTSELIPIALASEEPPAPEVVPSEKPPEPVAMWQPKETRKLGGATALVLGIVIGAVLFGAVLVAVLALK